MQVKGTGLANRCPEVKGEGKISVSGNNVKLVDLCIEPKTWQVEEEKTGKRGEVKKEFVVATKRKMANFCWDRSGRSTKLLNVKCRIKKCFRQGGLKKRNERKNSSARQRA